MGKPKRKAKKPTVSLRALIDQQHADRIQDWQLTRRRDVTTKTSRYQDEPLPSVVEKLK